jgi:hypothetical protein
VKNAVIVVGLVVVALFAWIALGRGVVVTVENVGSTEITDVVVKVAGNEHAIGALDGGDSDSVKVAPSGTTKRVEVTWKSDGRACYGKHDVTFEDTGYNGTVRIAIDAVSVKATEDDIDTGFF